MSANGLLRLEERQAQEIAQALLARRLGYVPGWTPVEGGFGWASVQIYARFLRALAERLNQAPDKNKLAFLDMLGINLLPAQAARAPVVFEMQANARNSRAPARTRLGAKAPGMSEPLIYETENAIGLAAARLAEVRTVWPRGDKYADHSVAAIGGQPFVLFDEEVMLSVPHYLYLGHDTLFALAGDVSVDLTFDLPPQNDVIPSITWRYWDGKTWRKFADTSSYVEDPPAWWPYPYSTRRIHLTDTNADAQSKVVNGRETYWVRGELNESLTLSGTVLIPPIVQIRASTSIDRPVLQEECINGIVPEVAFADGQQLDLSKAFYPFGPLAEQGSAFYFACEEIAAKPGAQITVRVQKVVTPQEEADVKLVPYGKSLNQFLEVVELLTNAHTAASDVKTRLNEMFGEKEKDGEKDGEEDDSVDWWCVLRPKDLPSLFSKSPDGWHEELKDHLEAIWLTIYNTIYYTRLRYLVQGAVDAQTRYGPDNLAITYANTIYEDLVDMLTALSTKSDRSKGEFDTLVSNLRKKLKNWVDASDRDIEGLQENLRDLKDIRTEPYPGGTRPDFIKEIPETWWKSKLRTPIKNTQDDVQNVILQNLSTLQTKVEGGEDLQPPQLQQVRLIWEYWNGQAWKPLLGPEEDPAVNLLDSGSFGFEVPDDMASISINSVEAHWMRARIQKGTYHKLTIVSWQDENDRTNLIPVIEPRSPVLDAFYLCYSYMSSSERIEHCLTYNDFQFQDRTIEAENALSSFLVDQEHQKDLDQGVLSPKLQRAFYAHGITLSDGCEVEVVEKPLLQIKWIIHWSGLRIFLQSYWNKIKVLHPTFFEPFSVVNDRTPTVFLGLDRPLPADLMSLYLDVQEQETADLARDSVGWEYWDGTKWSDLPLYQDDTRNLTRPGVVAFAWPGVNTPPAADVVQASDTQVQLLDPRDAARFRRGDRVYVAEKDEGELATVDESSGDTLRLKTPLGRDYGRATVRPVTLLATPAPENGAGERPPLELARFGTPYTWIRARLPETQDEAEPPDVRVNGIYLNAVWAAQAQTTEDELIGSSTGQMNQVFFFRETPVLPQEQIEVRELYGERAHVEWPLLAREVLGADEGTLQALEERLKTETTTTEVEAGSLRLRRDRNGRVSEVWVRWQAQPNLLFSGPDERHYVVERSAGRVIFGDGRHGKVPPAGVDNVVARHYCAGGGLEGNVGAKAIEQLLGAVPYAQAVANPHPAEGGADGEALLAVQRRGPQALRHRRQAITLSDYEALAREASPAVAVARALPATALDDDQGVKVIIMPQSQESQPQPSLALRQCVEEFLAARTPATMAGRVMVSGPTTYLPINVWAEVVAADPSATGIVREEAVKALQAFLHPLTGGPGRDGWPFGRDVYRSDVAAVLASVAGVDYVASLELSVDDDPSIIHDEWIDVPEYHIVVAGQLNIEMDESER